MSLSIHYRTRLFCFPRAFGRSENHASCSLTNLSCTGGCHTNECAAHMKHTSVSTVTCHVCAMSTCTRATTRKTKTPPKSRTRYPPFSSAPAAPASMSKSQAESARAGWASAMCSRHQQHHAWRWVRAPSVAPVRHLSTMNSRWMLPAANKPPARPRRHEARRAAATATTSRHTT